MTGQHQDQPDSIVVVFQSAALLNDRPTKGLGVKAFTKMLLFQSATLLRYCPTIHNGEDTSTIPVVS